MRYNKRLNIVVERGVETYNPKTHRKEKQPDKMKTIPCHLAPINLERSMAIFGYYDRSIIVARCLGKSDEQHEQVEIDGVTYKVLRQIDYRQRFELYLEVVR